MYRTLQGLTRLVLPSAWPETPQLQVRGNKIICQAVLNADNSEHGPAGLDHTEPGHFISTFEVDGENWFFRHLESINIPMDSVPTLPADYYGAAEPPFRSDEDHPSGRTDPPLWCGSQLYLGVSVLRPYFSLIEGISS